MAGISGNRSNLKPVLTQQQKARTAYNSGIKQGLVDSVTTWDGIKETATSAVIGLGTGVVATATVASAPVWGTAAVIGAGAYGVYKFGETAYDKYEERKKLINNGNIDDAVKAGHSTGQMLTDTAAGAAGGWGGSKISAAFAKFFGLGVNSAPTPAVKHQKPNQPIQPQAQPSQTPQADNLKMPGKGHLIGDALANPGPNKKYYAVSHVEGEESGFAKFDSTGGFPQNFKVIDLKTGTEQNALIQHGSPYGAPIGYSKLQTNGTKPDVLFMCHPENIQPEVLKIHPFPEHVGAIEYTVHDRSWNPRKGVVPMWVPQLGKKAEVWSISRDLGS